MFVNRQGYPQEEELVLCTITSIQVHSVFAKLDEYENKSGMVHISEVASGRVRDIRDFIREGQKIVCKVLGVNLEKGHIDLSIRRVNSTMQRRKTTEIKEEQLAFKIIEYVAQKLGKKPEVLAQEIATKLWKEYPTIYSALIDVAQNKADITKCGIDKTTAKEIEEVAISRLKPKEIRLGGDFAMRSYAPNGLQIIRKILDDAIKIKGASIIYLGGGKYQFKVTATDYKEAEKELKRITEKIFEQCKSAKIIASFTRKDEKK